MRKSYILFLLVNGLLAWTVWTSCKKDKVTEVDCQRLQNAIVNANKDEAKVVINKFINSLSSQDYTEQNLNNLVTAIGQRCGTNAISICFDCIKTLPSQSEIRISYFSISGPIEKTIDITYSTTGNKMVFHNLHD